MNRRRLTFGVIALVWLVAFGATAQSASAQGGFEPVGYGLQSSGGNDLQSATQVSLGWDGFWSARFGSSWVFGWERASVRSGSGRTPVAVLRERLGLLR